MPVFGLVVAMDVTTGLLALLVLKPIRRGAEGREVLLF
jgi:hypothetical protein